MVFYAVPNIMVWAKYMYDKTKSTSTAMPYKVHTNGPILIMFQMTPYD